MKESLTHFTVYKKSLQTLLGVSFAKHYHHKNCLFFPEHSPDSISPTLQQNSANQCLNGAANPTEAGDGQGFPQQHLKRAGSAEKLNSDLNFK